MTGRYSPLSLAALRALDIPPVEYVVDGLLPRGSSTLLSAREKAGKGLFTIDLLASVALEETFLGYAVKTGPVIYCPAEEALRLVRDRVLNRVGDRDDIDFHVLPLNGSTPDRLDLESGDNIASLDAMMGEIKPIVIVLDTLRELHRGREDHSDDMAPLLRPFRQLAEKHNCAVVVNHHMNKLGGSRGSTAIPAAFDQIIEFSRDDNSDSTVSGGLRIEGRDVARTFLKIKYGAGGRWSINGDAVPTIEGDARSRILHLLPFHPVGLTSDQIAERIGVEKKTVQNLMSAMRKERPMRLAVISNGKKGAPAVYGAIQPEMIPPDPSPLGIGTIGTNPEMVPDSSGTHGTNPGTNDDDPGSSPSRNDVRAGYDLPPGHVLLSPEDPLGNVKGTVNNIAAMSEEDLAAYRAEVEALTGDDPDTLHDRAALAAFDRMTSEIASMKRVGDAMDHVGRMNGEAPPPAPIRKVIERLRGHELGMPA